MNILLIGNFAPPYEEESLYNFSLLDRLRSEGNECDVINISENRSAKDGIADITGHASYLAKLFRLSRKKDVIHFLTRGYTRLGLLKAALSVLVGSLFRARTVITFHSELLSVIGLTRSPFGGQQTVNFTFSRAHRIIFSDKDTSEVASVYKSKDNFSVIPSFLSITEGAKSAGPHAFKKLDNKEKVIVFSNVIYPSLLFDMLRSMLMLPVQADTGIVISLSEKPTAKLQHVIEDSWGSWTDSLVFIEPDNLDALTKAYVRADLVLRPLSCDGKIFFPGFMVSMKMPVRSGSCLSFPESIVLLKEGDAADLCSRIIKSIVREKTGTPRDIPEEDYFNTIRDIYGE